MHTILYQTEQFSQYEETLKRVCDFLNMEVLTSEDTIEETIKQLCVARLCKAIGIRCAYNAKKPFFNFFSSIIGEALMDKLGLKLKIDNYNLKYVKFEDVNLVFSARFLLENPDIDEAFIDVFNLANRFRYLIDHLKKV